MNAIPLSDPTGTVVAWQCGVCLHVATTGTKLWGPAPVETFAAYGRQCAEECCRCERCKGPLVGERFGVCAKCKPAEDTERVERDARWEADGLRREAVREAAIAKALDRDKAATLLKEMRAISELHFAAGWSGGLEEGLWSMVLGGSRECLVGALSEDDVESLRNLFIAAGGWWRFDDEAYEVFVPAEEWAVRYAEHVSRLSDKRDGVEYKRDMAATKRRASAAQSRRSHNGNVGEEIVNALHLRCQLSGVAIVTKVASNLKVVGSLGKGLVKAAMVKKSVVDFLGYSLTSGRVVAVEAKHVAVTPAARTPWAPCSLSMSRVEDHQRADLDRVLKAGGVAVLLVVHGNLATYAVPWSEAREVKGTLRGDALEKHKVGPREAYLSRWLEGEK